MIARLALALAIPLLSAGAGLDLFTVANSVETPVPASLNLGSVPAGDLLETPLPPAQPDGRRHRPREAGRARQRLLDLRRAVAALHRRARKQRGLPRALHRAVLWQLQRQSRRQRRQRCPGGGRAASPDAYGGRSRSRRRLDHRLREDRTRHPGRPGLRFAEPYVVASRRYHACRSPGSGFDLTGAAAPLQVAPGEAARFEIGCTPAKAGLVTGTLDHRQPELPADRLRGRAEASASGAQPLERHLRQRAAGAGPRLPFGEVARQRERTVEARVRRTEPRTTP